MLIDAVVWSIEKQWLHGALSIFRSKSLVREKTPTEETREMGEPLRDEANRRVSLKETLVSCVNGH